MRILRASSTTRCTTSAAGSRPVILAAPWPQGIDPSSVLPSRRAMTYTDAECRNCLGKGRMSWGLDSQSSVHWLRMTRSGLPE